MKLDLPTLTVMTAFACTVLPVLTWITLMSRRDRILDLWCLGGLVVGLGWLLAGLRGHVSDWWSLVAGFALLIGSLALRVHALRLMLGRKNWSGLLTGMVLMSCLIFAAMQWEGDHHTRGMVARISFAVGSFGVSWFAWQAARKERSTPMRWIALAFGAMGAGFTDLAVASMLNPTAPRALGWSDYWTFTLTTAMFTNILSHLGFATVLLEREKRDQIKNQRQTMADQASRQLGQELAHLKRKRDLSIVGSSLIHDLSQPLAALLVHAEVMRRSLQKQAIATESTWSALEKINSNCERCESILNTTLNGLRDRVEDSQLVLLVDLVKKTWELLEPKAEIHHIAFRLIAKPDICLEGSATQLMQIMLNLLRNAVDALEGYPGQREITVRIDERDAQVILEVQDTGPGIAPELLGRLFAPYATTKSNGLGLGLAICQVLVQKMGGTLQVETPSIGGSVFSLRLPCAPLHLSQRHAITPH